MQRASYEQFLQMGMTPAERRLRLQAAFGSVFPIEDVRGTCSLRRELHGGRLVLQMRRHEALRTCDLPRLRPRH